MGKKVERMRKVERGTEVGYVDFISHGKKF